MSAAMRSAPRRSWSRESGFMGWLGDVERIGIAENKTYDGVGARLGVALHQGHKMSHAFIVEVELAQCANDEGANRLHFERVAADEKISRSVFVAVLTRRVRSESACGFCRTGGGDANKALAVSPERTRGSPGEKDSVDKQGGVVDGRCHIEKAGLF